MRAYLAYVRAEAARHFAAGRSALEAARRIDLGPYAGWTEPERILFNVERAYRELRGDPWDAPLDALALFRGMYALREAWRGGCPRRAGRGGSEAQARAAGGGERRPRVAQIERLEGVDDRLGDGEIPIPLVVGGNHVPGRVGRPAAREQVLVGALVGVPEPPLPHVGLGELPRLRGVGEPCAQPRGLLPLADVEEELEDHRAALDEQALEVVDLPVARLERRARHRAVHARDEHVLVVRAIEDRDVTTPGRVAMDAPEEVVRGLLLGRRLERNHLAPARVDARHDVLDGAVLPGRVHPLEDDQHREAAVGVEHVLEAGEALDVAPELGARGGLVGMPARVGGIEVGEAHARARSHEMPPHAAKLASGPPCSQAARGLTTRRTPRYVRNPCSRVGADARSARRSFSRSWHPLRSAVASARAT